MSLIMTSMWLFSLIFIFLDHPLSLGLILLLQSICTSLLMGLISLNFWYSYMIFLIMVGGMLVLFLYMTSIASNEKFFFSMKLFYLSIMFMFILILIYYLNKHLLMLNINNIFSTYLMNKSNFFLSMNKYFIYPMNMTYMILIIYLFITLIAVVKITSINHGPLRQMH
uniref:NADH-ubiquinone oxidoreductase chain 6 n=1 Tax=Cucujoidea sp. 46 KM-2017 TaxID=2219385 RepID=A0A346RJ61_9CUCU|nr:NADH dehydrogenase subunit 6 [Cucujoidea sp. 46 KM-2017]